MKKNLEQSLINLFSGDFGLKKTFWLYWFAFSGLIYLVGFIVVILISLLLPSYGVGSVFYLLLIYYTYSLILSLAVLKSAFKWNGESIYKWLAIAAVLVFYWIALNDIFPSKQQKFNFRSSSSVPVQKN